MKKIFILFSLLLLIYLLWPGPGSVSQFKPLPNSAKSTLSGDTIQIPNVSAYFSYNFRDFVTPFYYQDYQQIVKLPFPPLKLNHPPEYSWTAIKKHTDSIYLEEYVYPLRDSLYVNGFETHRPDGSLIFWGAPRLDEGGKIWFTKTTLRLYPSNTFIRIIVWFEIVISMILIYRLGRRIIKE